MRRVVEVKEIKVAAEEGEIRMEGLNKGEREMLGEME